MFKIMIYCNEGFHLQIYGLKFQKFTSIHLYKIFRSIVMFIMRSCKSSKNFYERVLNCLKFLALWPPCGKL